MKQTLVCIGCDWLFLKDGCEKIAVLHVTLKAAIKMVKSFHSNELSMLWPVISGFCGTKQLGDFITAPSWMGC